MSASTEVTLVENEDHKTAPGWRRFLRRGPCENVATAIIALGVFMLMQPFSMALFSYSFAVVLMGTVGFVICSHFPE